MARGWGGSPPDLKGTLGTLIRTTLIQLAGLRDAARAELDNRREWAGNVLFERKRTQVLAGIGEIIVELARAGELELGDFPEVKRAIDELTELDGELGDPAAPARREPIGVWRPPVDGDEAEPGSDPDGPLERPTRRGARAANRIAFVSGEAVVDDDEDLSEYMHDDDVPGAESE
jgi:hypothetical protein